MKSKYVTLRSALITLALGCVCFNAQAIDGYAPPITFQKNILTYNIKQDGSYLVINENSRRIETDAGVSSSGEMDISYTPKLESVKIQDAYTILPNGKHIKVAKKNIRTTNDELDRGGSSYSDKKHMIIIFPNVVVGSQLYCKYTKIVHTPTFPGQFTFIKSMLPHYRFEHFEVNINFDPRINIKLDSKGFEGGKLPDRNGMHRYSYIFKQDKYLPFEANQIEIQDYAPFVQATSFPSYEALGAAYQKKAKEKARVTPAIQKLANELTAGVDDKKAQTSILYNWVAKNIRYVGSYIGNGGFVPHDSQTILDNKWGDCKDHVVILEALLAAKGIESSPALINTERSYVLPKLAATIFNHVITYVPSLDIYLDSTDRLAPFGVLSEENLDKQVILTGLDKMGKTPSMRAEEHKVSTSIFLKVLADGTIEGTSKTSSSGAAEIGYRYMRARTRDEPQEKVANDILKSNNLTGVGQLYSSDPTDLDKPLEIYSTFTLDPISRFPGPAAMSIPAGLSFAVINGKMLAKPRSKFVFPEHCGSFTHSDHYEIEFPSSIKIKSIPGNVSYRDNAGRYSATYTLNGNILKIDRELMWQHPSMICGEAELEMDKKFFPIFQSDMLAQVIYE